MGRFRSRIDEVLNNRLPELTERLAEAVNQDDRPRIKHYLDRVVYAHFDKLGYGGAMELELAGLRFDWAGFGSRTDAPAEATVVETKTGRDDLRADSKLDSYRKWCHRLWVCAPAGRIEPARLPRDTGLLEFSAPFDEDGAEADDPVERVRRRSGLRVAKEAPARDIDEERLNEFVRVLVRKLTFYPPLGTIQAEAEPEFI